MNEDFKELFRSLNARRVEHRRIGGRDRHEPG
jgi:hypothetical protein